MHEKMTPVEAMRDAILADMFAWREGRQDDDMSLVVARRIKMHLDHPAIFGKYGTAWRISLLIMPTRTLAVRYSPKRLTLNG